MKTSPIKGSLSYVCVILIIKILNINIQYQNLLIPHILKNRSKQVAKEKTWYSVNRDQIITLYILSFIEYRGEWKRTLNSCVYVCVYVCLCVCLCTFLNAWLARTRGPILLRFGTRTEMLIGYGLRELLWDAPILWRHNHVFLFFEAALWRPQFL